MMTKNNTPNPTDGRMKDKKVNAISDYLKPNMPLPQYLPYARFLLDADLSHTSKLLYTLLLDRATLSQKNNWVDDRGRIYVIYPLSNLAKDLGCCVSSVTRSFAELEKAELAESRVPIKQYLQKFPQWGRFGVTPVTPFLLLPVHPEGYTPAHHT